VKGVLGGVHSIPLRRTMSFAETLYATQTNRKLGVHALLKEWHDG